MQANNSKQTPLWMCEENNNVIDSSTYTPNVMEYVNGYDTTGCPRTGKVLSSFYSEGRQYFNVKTDDGNIYTITRGVLNG